MTARHETGAWLNPSRARIGDAMPRTLNPDDDDDEPRTSWLDEQPHDKVLELDGPPSAAQRAARALAIPTHPSGQARNN